MLKTNSIQRPEDLLPDKAFFDLMAGTQLLQSDSLIFNLRNHTNGSIAWHHGTRDNYISTQTLGHDGSALAMLFPFDRNVSIEGFTIDFGPNTVAGGDIQIEIYDSSNFDLLYGFSGQARFSAAYPIPNSALNGSPAYFNAPNPIFHNQDSIIYCYLVLWLYSNNGATPIEIANSHKAEQPKGTVFYHNGKTAIWKDALDTSNYIRSPLMEMSTLLPHIDPFPSDLGENEVYEWSIFPNPSAGTIHLDLPDISHQQCLSVAIVDISGKSLIRKNVCEYETIDISELKTGMYYVQIEADNKVFRKKLILQD